MLLSNSHPNPNQKGRVTLEVNPLIWGLDREMAKLPLKYDSIFGDFLTSASNSDPEIPLLLNITPNHPKWPKRVKKGYLGDIWGERVILGVSPARGPKRAISRPNMVISGL